MGSTGNIIRSDLLGRIMKKIDDTVPPKTESEVTREMDILPLERLTRQLVERIVSIEHELALLLEQRETVRAPECQEDPEWY